jgi:hypothetical protein
MDETNNRQPSDQYAALIAKSRELLQLITRLLAKRLRPDQAQENDQSALAA